MQRLKIALLLIMLIITVSCRNDKDVELFNDVKSLGVSSPFTIATIYDDSIVMPYPNIELLNEEQGLNYTLSFISLDGNRRYMNSNPSNKCNSGKLTECSGYRESLIQATLFFKNKLVLIEDKFEASTFTNYTTISTVDIDGSNLFEIDRSEEQATRNNLIALGDNKIYYSLSNNILIEYDYDKNSKTVITNDNDSIRDVSTIFFESGKLYIHARLYDDGVEVVNYPILSYENNGFKVVANNVQGHVTHINEDFYVVDPSNTSNNKSSHIVYYDGDKKEYSQNFFASIGTVKYKDYLIINYLEEKEDKLFTKIKLYKIKNGKVKYLDEITSDETYYINAVSNNVIALTYGEKISDEIPTLGIFPAYTSIENDKLKSITKIKK